MQINLNAINIDNLQMYSETQLKELKNSLTKIALAVNKAIIEVETAVLDKEELYND